jgi:replicative DNA helicase
MYAQIESMRSQIGGGYNKPDISDLSIYRSGLSVITKAQDFLKIQRNLSDETIRKFDLGFDVVNQRISIPETKNREIINIAYRFINNEEKVKYLKEKGCENWIFNENGLDTAREKGGILIVSNQFDAMSAYQAGFKNVVSVPVGKDGVGSWIELFDAIPNIYICFENTKVGKKMGIEFADRLGMDKCNEVTLPEDCKDLNDYFRKFDGDSFRGVLKKARPYYKYTYSGLADIISKLREKKEEFIKFNCIPHVEWEYGTTGVLSGVTNIGKTSVALNIANELVDMGVGVLVIPIERGIETAGKRFLQVRYKKTKDELRNIGEEEWNKIIPDVIELPIYFSNPKPQNLEEVIIKSKKLFNVKFIIIDHLDLLVRKSDGKNYNVEMSGTIQNICRIGQENNMTNIVIHHIKKQEGVGSVPKKPSLNDLKGSGSVKDDPEIVVMLSEPDNGLVEVEILKNKGEMGSRIYKFNKGTGVVGQDVTDIPELLTEKLAVQSAFNQM